MLRIEGLTVRFGETTAVADVSLHVDPGEIVALLGPSGSGKTTILRAVTGLVTPVSGRIYVDGRDLTRLPPDQRGVGLMFQDYALFMHTDVAGNVGFGVRMQKGDRQTVAGRVADVLALVGLDGYQRRSIPSLSGGEQQRVALARALAPAPPLLLLDEPLGSLDRALRERLSIELRDLFRALGITVVTVTHDQGEAFTVADRVVVLRDGRVVQEGRPVQVWRQPADAFVARFLGFANVLPIDVHAGKAETPLGPVPVGVRPDGPAALVIRPDGLALTETGTRGVAGAAAFRGDHFLVPVRLADGTTVEVVDRTGVVPADGATVAVTLDAAAAVAVPLDPRDARDQAG